MYTPDHIGLPYYQDKPGELEAKVLAHLKTCPMCGNEVRIWSQEIKHGGAYRFVQCTHCGLRSRRFDYEVRGGYASVFAQLLIAWNLRHLDEDYYALSNLKEKLEEGALLHYSDKAEFSESIINEACGIYDDYRNREICW